MNKAKVVIGIPAFNEEKNIEKLLTQLCIQKTDTVDIVKIIVMSDGSTDNTVDVARKIRSSLIEVVDNRERRGKYYRENEMFETVKSDILIILDADISLQNKNFVQMITNPIKSGMDLVSIKASYKKPQYFIQKLLAHGMDFQNNIVSQINGGDNVYSCRGVARAFSKKFYSKLRYKPYVGEDAFSYFHAKLNNYKYMHLDSLEVLVTLPSTYKDYWKQSTRFDLSQKLMAIEFGKTFTSTEYNIPLKILVSNLIKSLIKSPMYFTCYLLMNRYSKSKIQTNNNATVLWDISKSSKVEV